MRVLKICQESDEKLRKIGLKRDYKQRKMGRKTRKNEIKKRMKNSKKVNIIHDTVDPLSLGSNPIYPF